MSFKEEAAKEYQRNEEMIKKIVKRYHKALYVQHGFDDLIGEAHIVFMKLFKQRKKGKGFRTLLSKSLNNHFIDMIRTEQRQYKKMIFYTDDSYILQDMFVTKQNAVTNINLKEKIMNMSEEAKEVIDIILHGPEEVFECFFDSTFPPKMIRGQISRILKQKKWGCSKIQRAYREIRTTI